MEENTYRIFDTSIKIVGLVALLISGWFAWHQYEGIREREFKQDFYQQQIATINNVFTTLSNIDNAQTPAERNAAVEKFWMIYQGSGRTFLDPEMFRALSVPADYINGCITKIHTTWVPCSNFTASMSAAHFAQIARKELSLGWNMGFKEIGAQDPWMLPPKQSN